MHYRDWGNPITLDTPLPAPPKASEKKLKFRVHFSDSDDDSDDDDDEETPAVGEPSGSGPTSSTPRAPPRTSTPAPSTPIPTHRPSRESEASTILPILAVPPNQRMSLQHLFPLLQDTFLGLLNHVVHLQNQTRDSLFQVLGHPPPQPFPTFEHPYRSTPTSPSTAQTPQAPHTTSPTTTITPEMLAASLEAATAQTASAVEPVLQAVSELVSNIPSSSRQGDDSEDEVIIMDAPPDSAQTTSVEPAPADTTAVEPTSPQPADVDPSTATTAEVAPETATPTSPAPAQTETAPAATDPAQD